MWALPSETMCLPSPLSHSCSRPPDPPAHHAGPAWSSAPRLPRASASHRLPHCVRVRTREPITSPPSFSFFFKLTPLLLPSPLLLLLLLLPGPNTALEIQAIHLLGPQSVSKIRWTWPSVQESTDPCAPMTACVSAGRALRRPTLPGSLPPARLPLPPAPKLGPPPRSF